MFMEVATATSLTLRCLLDRGTALSQRYAQARRSTCSMVAPATSCRQPPPPARPPPRFIPALWRVKNQLSGYSDLRQCPQNPHAASSYASVPTSPAALARVRRVAFILFGHRCDTGDSEGACMRRVARASHARLIWGLLRPFHWLLISVIITTMNHTNNWLHVM